MEYRKETHFIVAYDANEKMKGKWDILTNKYIGVKGGVLKSRPNAFTISVVVAYMDNILQSAFRFLQYADKWHPFTPQYGQKIEEIISVGLTIADDWSLWRDFLNDKQKLNKDYVQYIKDNYHGIYSRSSIQGYSTYKKYKDIIDKCDDHKDWAMSILHDIGEKVPRDFVKGMILRGIHEKVFWARTAYDFARIINHWYDYVTAMGDKLEVKHNILTNYVILQWLYEEYKNSHYDENLKHYNDKAWLYFEDDNYVVAPLLTRKQFHIEAEAQQNCVERLYMERVAEGKTHVVGIRRKSQPDVPYITCEVALDGDIVQYLLKYNNYPYKDDDRSFRFAYQAHLRSSCEV